jgi:1-acyl-sn-glycerol-3-phosphate acyltransferase
MMLEQGWRSNLWYEANFWATWVIYTLGFSLRTEGSLHLPRQGPVLLIANHESFLDPVAVGLAARRKINYLARKTLFNNPVFGKYLRSVGSVPVDQDGVAKEGIKTSLELLKAGRALLIFPEGERTLTGQMNPFKPGISLLIKRVKAPIVPVGVAGAYEAYPRGQLLPRLSPLFWPWPKGAVAVSIGKPIAPGRLADLGREQLLETLFNEVQTMVQRAEKLRRKP